ncbi:MAG: lipid-A-disaccharide synthase [Brevirhabdus sp.]
MTLSVYLIAGEASGDKLGAALMAGLRHLCPAGVQFDGVGGPLMEAEGLKSLFPMSELSVMGLLEVLPKYRQLKRRIEEVADEVIARRPDVLITIDSPDFCLRVAKKVKAASDTRIVHYVAPTVWAWREHRSERMAEVIDQVLALLPFEPAYMRAAGMRCDFVGHPVVAEPDATEGDIDMFRLGRQLVKADPLVAVLPGSRKGEVSRLLPEFAEAARRIAAHHPQVRFVIPTTRNTAELVKQGIKGWPGNPVFLDPRDRPAVEAEAEKRAALAAAQFAIAASGTVSLELAAADTPMVIAYDMNWLSRQIIARMLKVDTVTLVNLVSETRTIPEYLGPDCKGPLIGKAMLRLIEDKDAQARQREAMDVTMERLGYGEQPPGLRAARAVLEGLGLPVTS